MSARAEIPPCIICQRTTAETFIEMNDYRIVRCLSCGLRYLSPQPSSELLGNLYEEDYFQGGGLPGQGYSHYLGEDDNWRATFRERLRLLPTPFGRKRLLDVGTATGLFIEQACLAGWRAQGVEPSGWAARYARERLGLEVSSGTLEGARFPSSYFELVTLWEVLEHVPDPKRFLLEVARILAPDGWLALSTPDAGSWAARLSGRRWLGWKKVPEHLFFFDKRSLFRLLQSTGFVVVEYGYVSLTVTWRYALERLGTMMGVPSLFKLAPWILDRSLRINPRYDLMVTARLR